MEGSLDLEEEVFCVRLLIPSAAKTTSASHQENEKNATGEENDDIDVITAR